MNQQIEDLHDDGPDDYSSNYYFLDRRAATGKTTPVVWGVDTVVLGEFTQEEIEKIAGQLEASYARRDIRDENTSTLAFASEPIVIYLQPAAPYKGKCSLTAIATGPAFDRKRALNYLQTIANTIPRKNKILGII